MLPPTLYKYLHPDRVDVLKGLQIRFTQPGDLNDPCELSPAFADAYVSDYIETELVPRLRVSNWPERVLTTLHQQYDRLSPETRNGLSLEEYLRRGAAVIGHRQVEFERLVEEQIANLRQDTTELRRMMLEGVTRLANERLGVLSLSASPAISLLWGHYTNGNRGFVLALNTQDEFFDPADWSTLSNTKPCEAVAYSDRQPVFESRLDGPANDRALLFSKPTAWAYEEEWRALRRLGHGSTILENKYGEYPIHLFPIPAEAVKAVILADRASTQTENAIRSIIQDNPRLAHVAVQRLSRSGYGFSIVDA